MSQVLTFTEAYKKWVAGYDYHHFNLTTLLALQEWEFNTRQSLADGSLSDTTICLKYGSDEIPVAVGTPTELLQRRHEVYSMLRRTVLVAAVADLEGYLKAVRRELQTVCPAVKQQKRPANRTLLEKLENLARITYADAPPAVNRQAVLEVMATRNLLVHSSQIVDHRYLKRVPDSLFRVGETRNISSIYVNDSLWAISALIRYIDHKVLCEVALSLGMPEPQFEETGYTRRPKQGHPRKTLKCWCICPPGDANGPRGIVGIAAVWSRCGVLPGGYEVASCQFELEPEQRLPMDREVVIFRSLDDPVESLDQEVLSRLRSHGMSWSANEKLREFLVRLNIMLD